MNILCVCVEMFTYLSVQFFMLFLFVASHLAFHTVVVGRVMDLDLKKCFCIECKVGLRVKRYFYIRKQIF